MARSLRIEFPGAIYHVTSRGNARRDIVRDDADRQEWLDWLRRTVETYGWRTDDASRTVAAYLARRRFGHPAGEVAKSLGYRRTEVEAVSPAPSRGWSQAPSNSDAPRRSWKQGCTNH